jgi:hypothetical protein
VVSSNLTNLRILKSQLLALRTFNLDATTTPAYTKYRMFSSLLLYTAFYYVADLALFVVATRQGLAPRWLTTLLRQLLELTTAFLIGYAFRARPLNVMFEQVESEAVEVARDLLPSLTTVTVDVTALRGEGTVPWSRGIDLHAASATPPQPGPRGTPPSPPPPPDSTSRPTSSSSSTVPAPPQEASRGAEMRRDMSSAPPEMRPDVSSAPPEMLVVLNPADDHLDHGSSVERALVVAVRIENGEYSRPRSLLGSVGSAVAVPFDAMRSLLGGVTPWESSSSAAAPAAGPARRSSTPSGERAAASATRGGVFGMTSGVWGARPRQEPARRASPERVRGTSYEMHAPVRV